MTRRDFFQYSVICAGGFISLPTYISYAYGSEINKNEDDIVAIPIIMFHKVVDTPQYPEDISPDELKDLFDYMFKQSYYPINMSDLLLNRIEDVVPNGYMPIVITADDSHPSILFSKKDANVDTLNTQESFIEIFKEVCKKHKFEPRVTLFLSEVVDDRYSKEPLGYFANIEELKEIIQKNSDFSSIEYGYHTIEHKLMKNMSYDEVKDTLERQMKAFEDMGVIKQISPIFAYPYGYPPQKEFIKIFKDLGFIGAVTAYPGNSEAKYQDIEQYLYNQKDKINLTDPFFIPRVNIGSFTYIFKDGKFGYEKINPIDDFKKDVEATKIKSYKI